MVLVAFARLQPRGALVGLGERPARRLHAPDRARDAGVDGKLHKDLLDLLAVGEGLRRYDEATWPVAKSNSEAMAPPCPVPTLLAPFEVRGLR